MSRGADVTAVGLPSLHEWLEKVQLWCAQAGSIEPLWSQPEARAGLADAAQWIDARHIDVCAVYLDERPQTAADRQLRLRLRKAKHAFDGVKGRMALVATA